MFKKLKDKLAEEVKSSPQRIQQFAQAAQAAVTSASSSISDITNSDLFSIGDNDNPQNSQARTQVSPSKPHNTFQDVNLMQSTSDSFDYPNEMDPPRQRRLSNSSFASDVSFRLPSYETPSMYHLQSDVEVSASEADERGFSGGPATLDRVTKEQLYSAYKRTQERYTKYRTQYSDLARHYKLLERENAKARSVLVETQDKALRRISELKEQCSLEQSAKAHLEKAMRFEIEEKNIKIDTLNTKIRLLQSDGVSNDGENKNNDEKIVNEKEKEVQLINLESESRTEDSAAELTTLTNRIEKMEMLLYKYKESLKSTKEKNSQITAELQKVSLELESKNKEIEELKLLSDQLNEAKKQVKKLNDDNETLQNQVNTFDFNKTRELSTLELDLNKANEEIAALQKNIDVFHKREEEYAISLAENKLSIHKELESKETEIKSLKDHLSASKQEIQSLNIVITDYKTKVSSLEEDKTKLQNDCAELSTIKTKFNEMDAQLQELSKKCHALEQLKTKADEEYKCLELQMKQETAEKLAMIDRNTYLESRNSQLTEDITKKNSQIGNLENDLKKYSTDKNKEADAEKNQMLSEIRVWKEKCGKLESEIQEERVELVKLQEEIEKLLANHELIQTQNAEFRVTIANLTSENNANIQAINAFKEIVGNFKNVMTEIKLLRNSIADTSQEVHTLMAASFGSFGQDISEYVTNCIQQIEKNTSTINAKFDKLTKEHKKLKTDYDNICNMNLDILRESDKIREQNIKLTKEVETSQDKLKKISEEHEAGVKEIDLLKAEIVALNENCKVIQATSQETQLSLRDENKERSETFEKLKSIELEKKQLQDKLESLEKEKVLLTKECGKLKQEHTELNGKVSELLTEITSKTNEVKKYKSNQESLEKKIAQYTLNNEKISQLNKDKQVLEVEIKELKNKNNDLSAKLNELHALEDKTNEFTKKLKEFDELKIKNKELNEQLSELEELKMKNEDLLADLSELNELRNENDELIAELSQFSEFKAKHKELGEQLNELNQMRHSSKRILAEMNGFKDLQRVSEETIYRMSCDLESQSEEIGEKLLQITELEEKNRSAVQENTRLKAETSKFIRDINQLESELDDIQKSHAELEKEKNRLNNIIEKLEANEKAKHSNAVSQNTQTDENSNNALPKPDADMFENKWVLENKQAMTNTASLNLNKNVQDESFQKYSLLKISYDELKDENKRLQSDIEGLQSYLTKISKENSTLNDKLREVIATSEHCADDAPPEFKELRNEMKLTKEKLNDLMRENSLLIEENLELKDQLQPQNYSKAKDLPQTTRDNNNDSNNDKYDNLVKMQNQLQQRNTDLEQMNKSMNGNVMQLQDKNERLRLSNEKLERRLDEALVSLRHLHSLQENTELEYLRNILYEYLTGSGSHSVTLAKVLSAIVKFDDSQTQLVLQKEKERQGFLRQLGLI